MDKDLLKNMHVMAMEALNLKENMLKEKEIEKEKDIILTME